ncbi:MAG: 3-methyl-2-oxobutanoate hydroxymethyltransferase [Candidatus Dormibacterales bacterium]
MSPPRVDPAALLGMKREGRKIVVLTAYDAPIGALVDRAGADIIIVGDSLALFVLGQDSTLSVTVDQMIHHAAAVRRGVVRAMVVGDLPYGSYEASPGDAIRVAGRLLNEGGVDAVKIPATPALVPTVGAVAKAGIPVLAHLVPSTVAGTTLDSFEPTGQTAKEADAIEMTSLEFEAAGAFAVLLETVEAAVARRVRAALTVPVIGFGSGPDCDGQVGSTYHVLGLAPARPPFMREYADLSAAALRALSAFSADVISKSFPSSSERLS